MEWNTYLLSLLAGIILGLFYFGGLWFTVRKIHTTPYPALWVVSSFVIRVGILIISFYGIVSMNWLFLVVAFIGFILARIFVVQRYKQDESSTAGEEYGV